MPESFSFRAGISVLCGANSGAYIQCFTRITGNEASRIELLYKGVFGCLRFIFFFLQCVVKMDGTHIKAIDSVGDPPLPIPNREVKPDSADGTANVCGRVGHRHFYKKRASVTEALFFCYMPLIPLVYSGPMVLQTCV